MADKELSDLTSATTLDGTELFYAIQSANSRKVAGSEIVKISHTQAWSTITGTPTTLSGYGITDAATSAQGALADTATQPGDLATVATSGSYEDLDDLPTLGTAAATDATDYATAAQGTKADSALQPADIGDSVQAYDALLTSIAGLTTTSGDIVYATASDTVAALNIGTEGQVLKVSASGLPEWGAAAGGGDMLVSTYDPQEIGDDVFDRANHTGTQSADTITDGTTNKAYTAAEKTKLTGIETGADVTDATNVAAAGAVMESDTSTASMSFVGSGSDLSTDSDKLAKRGDVLANVTAYPADRAALAATDTDVTRANLAESGFQGLFEQVTAADYTDLIAADTVGGEIKVSSVDSSLAWLRTRKFGNLFKSSEFGGDVAVAIAVAAERHGKATVEINEINKAMGAGFTVPNGISLIGMGRDKTLLDFGSTASGNLITDGLSAVPKGIFVSGNGLTDIGVAFTAVAIGDKHITFSDAHGLVAGNIICAYKTADYSFGRWTGTEWEGYRDYYRAGQRFRVVAVEGNTVYLNEEAVFDYAGSGQHATTLYKQPSRSGEFGGFTLDFTGSTAINSAAAYFERLDGATVEDIVAYGSTYSGVVFNQCFDMFPRRLDCNTNIRSSFPDSLSPGNVDYPILISNCTRVLVAESKAAGNWCGTDIGGLDAPGGAVNYRSGYDDCDIMCTTSRAAGMHGNNYLGGYSRCRISGPATLAGYRAHLIDCDVRNGDIAAGDTGNNAQLLTLGEAYGGVYEISRNTFISSKAPANGVIYAYNAQHLFEEWLLRGRDNRLLAPNATRGIELHSAADNFGMSTDLHFAEISLKSGALYAMALERASGGSKVAKLNRFHVDSLTTGVPYALFSLGYEAEKYDYPEQSGTVSFTLSAAAVLTASPITLPHAYPVVPRVNYQFADIVAQPATAADFTNWPTKSAIRPRIFAANGGNLPASGTTVLNWSTKL